MADKRLVDKLLELPYRRPIFLAHLKSTLSECSTSQIHRAVRQLMNHGEMMRIGRGVYCRVKNTRFGPLGLTESDVVAFLTCANRGVLIGYRLYNLKGISTQISKNTEVISSVVPRSVHNILNVEVRHCNIELTESIIKASELLDIARRMGSIEDFNRAAYRAYVKSVIRDIVIPDLETACDVLSLNKGKREELKDLIIGLQASDG